MVTRCVEKQPQETWSCWHCLFDLSLLLKQLFLLRPLFDSLQVDVSSANLLPTVMFEARFLRLPAKFACQLENVFGQWIPTNVVIVHFRFFRVFRAENSKSLAICPVDRIEEVTEHWNSAFDASLENSPKASLRLVLVEASLQMSNGGSCVNLMAAGYAIYWTLILHVDVLLKFLIQRAMLRHLDQLVKLFMTFV